MRTPAATVLSILITLSVLFVPVSGSASPEAAVEPAAVPTAAAAPPVAAAAPPADPGAAVVAPSAGLSMDTEVFKRTPTIDGMVEEGEWDRFYIYSTGDWDARTFVDWDEDYVYMAAKSNKPFDFLVKLDANADGWFQGEGNYEFRAVRGSGGSLESTSGAGTFTSTVNGTTTTVSADGSVLYEMLASEVDGQYMAEMWIRGRLIRGFSLESGKKLGLKIGLRTDDDDTLWSAADMHGDLTSCTLVNKKLAVLKPLRLGFDLRSERVARGDELVGKFHVTNDGAESVGVGSIVLSGEGKAGDYLSSYKIRTEDLKKGQHISHEIKSVIPKDMALGNWAIGAEVTDGGERIGGALVSFEVVEPFEVELRVPEKPVPADVKDVTFAIIIRNNMQYGVSGEASILLPLGWELWRNIETKAFSTRGTTSTSVSFEAKPPLGGLGEVPVTVEVTIDGQTKTDEASFEVVLE